MNLFRLDKRKEKIRGTAEFRSMFDRLKNFVADNYEEELTLDEDAVFSAPQPPSLSAPSHPRMSLKATSKAKKSSSYFVDTLSESIPEDIEIPKKDSCTIGAGAYEPLMNVEATNKPMSFYETSAPMPQSLAGVVDSALSFPEYLQKMINKKGMKNADVYKAAGIQKQYFSKIMNGQTKPSKGKILAICIGLKLSLDEAVDLLNMAGYAFTRCSKQDLAVRYFLEIREYNIVKIEIAMDELGLPLLTE